MRYVVLVYVLFVMLQTCMSQEISEKSTCKRSDETPESISKCLSLSFYITKDAEGVLWARYAIKNNGPSGIIISSMMDLIYTFETEETKEIFHLSYDKGTPVIFYYVDPPPPGQAMHGLRTIDSQAKITGIALERLSNVEGLKKKYPGMIKNPQIVGRIEGVALRWNVETGDYERICFNIAAKPDPWVKYSHLFLNVNKQRK